MIYILLIVIFALGTIGISYFAIASTKTNWKYGNHISHIFDVGSIVFVMSAMIFFDYCLVSLCLCLPNANKYIEHNYKCVNTITIDPYEDYTVKNDTNKLYVLQEKTDKVTEFLFFQKEYNIGTVEDHSSYTVSNPSKSAKKIKVYESIKDSDKTNRDILNDLKNY